MTTPPISVSIVDDDDPFREGLAVLIGGSKGFRCLKTYRTGEAALEGIPRDRADVVLMDLNLPRMSGIETVAALRPKLPATQFLMLTVYEESERVFDSLKAGATGYLVKDTPPAEILEAIAAIHRGESPMSGHIARRVVQWFEQRGQTIRETEDLSRREREVLSCLSKGLRHQEIADALHISKMTVRSHLRRIYEKLHVTSGTQAVAKFLLR